LLCHSDGNLSSLSAIATSFPCPPGAACKSRIR
jgi:hypothetical protein